MTSLLVELLHHMTSLQVGHMTSDEILRDHLIPCLVEFATSANDDQWKRLNQQLLIYSKDGDPKVVLNGSTVGP